MGMVDNGDGVSLLVNYFSPATFTLIVFFFIVIVIVLIKSSHGDGVFRKLLITC